MRLDADARLAEWFVLAFILVTAFGLAVDAIETRVERAESHHAQ